MLLAGVKQWGMLALPGVIRVSHMETLQGSLALCCMSIQVTLSQYRMEDGNGNRSPIGCGVCLSAEDGNDKCVSSGKK